MTLEELKKLCDEATPGPWHSVALPREQSIYAYVTNVETEHYWAAKDEQTIAPVYWDYECAAVRLNDARFIAAARAALPKLIAVAEAADRLTDCAVEFPENTSGACDEWFNALCDALAALEAQ